MSDLTNDDDGAFAPERSALEEVETLILALEAENAVLKEQLRASRTRRGVAERVGNSAGAILDDVVTALREARLISPLDGVEVVPAAVSVLVEELLDAKKQLRELRAATVERSDERKRADAAVVEVARLTQLAQAYDALLNDAQSDARDWRKALVKARRGS